MAAKAEGGWKGEEVEEEEEEMPMAAAVTARRPCRKAPLRVVDSVEGIDLLLAVVGALGMTRGLVLVLLLLQLDKEEAASRLSSDVAAARACEAANLEFRTPVVWLWRGRRVPKAATGDGKQARTTTARRRRRGRRLGDIRTGTWQAMVSGKG